MKKLLGISLVAMMAVTSANAEIASKAYVDQQDNSVKQIVGALEELTAEGFTAADKASVAKAANAAMAKANTAAGDLSNYELKASVAGKGSATQPVYFDENGVAAPITSYPAANVTGLGDLATKSKVAEADLDSALGAKVTSYDTHIADGDIHVTAAQKTAWSGKQDALDSTQMAAVNSGATTELIGKITTNESAITTLNGNDQTVGSVDYKIAAAQTALNSDITDLEGRMDTAEGDIDTLEGKMTTAEGKITTAEGKIATAEGKLDTLTGTGAGSVSKAEADAKAYADSLASNYATKAQGQLADTAVQSVVEGTTAGAISVDGTAVPVHGLATVATSGSYDDLSNKPTVDQTYDGTSTNAQSGVAVASAISAAGGQTAQQVSDAINTKVATLSGGTAATAGNVVTGVTEANGVITVTQADPLSVTSYDVGVDGKYALTAVASGGKITGYEWELISRTGSEAAPDSGY